MNRVTKVKLCFMHKWASELVSMCMCTTIYNTHDDKWYSRELQTIFVNLQYEVTLSKMNIWNKSIRIRLLSSKVRILQPIPFRVPLGIRQSDSFYSGFLQQKNGLSKSQNSFQNPRPGPESHQSYCSSSHSLYVTLWISIEWSTPPSRTSVCFALFVLQFQAQELLQFK